MRTRLLQATVAFGLVLSLGGVLGVGAVAAEEEESEGGVLGLFAALSEGDADAVAATDFTALKLFFDTRED